MEQTHVYTPEQEIAWCKTVIHHAAVTLQRRYWRWARDELILNSVNEQGEEFQEQISDAANSSVFDKVEWNVILLSALNSVEWCLITGLYMSGLTQRNAANQCALSQSGVSRVHRQALQKLRREMTE